MFTPVPKGQFSLHQLVAAELKIFSETTVPPVQDMVQGSHNIKCGLHVMLVIWVSRIYTQFGRRNSFKKRLREVSDEPHKW